MIEKSAMRRWVLALVKVNSYNNAQVYKRNQNEDNINVPVELLNNNYGHNQLAFAA